MKRTLRRLKKERRNPDRTEMPPTGMDRENLF